MLIHDAEIAYSIEHWWRFTNVFGRYRLVRRMHYLGLMRMQGIELENRAAKLAAAIAVLSPALDAPVRAQKLMATARKHSEQVESGYRHARASSSPDEFGNRISAVATHARRTKASLMLLAQLGYVAVPDVRELILEARGLENIFVASRNTAKRRLRARTESSTRMARRV